MENIDRIIHHPIFKMSMKKIGECEKNREFCAMVYPIVWMWHGWRILSIWNSTWVFQRK